ncbi:MAG: hypothetical protein JWQ29_1737 [Phenylobacterium sp.]|nr:hypothetical protein [Phenylobacterium sp.]
MIETESYQVVDSYFGRPYIDRDEQRDTPVPHRNIHGGFENTDTRFTFYFPDQAGWKGRMCHPIEGGHAGHEDFYGGPAGELGGGLKMVVRLGGYMVESNSGHIGDDIDPRGGEDPTLYGHRAQIESARFSKHVCAQVYGEAPKYGYVWGGSGGGRRSPMCLEYGAGVYDGAVPFMGGGNIEPWGTKSRVRSDQPIAFGAMFNVQRLLQGDKLAGVIDAMRSGGSGNPYAGLSTHEREELAALYRLGFPRGDEFMISQPMGQMWLWTSIADMLQKEDAEYFQNFWTKPGYVGHDNPEFVADDLIDYTARVSRIVTAREFSTSPDFNGPEFAAAKPFIVMLAAMMGHMDLPIGVEVKGLNRGYRTGAGVKVVSGEAAGRQLYALNHGGDFLFTEGHGEANLLRFTGVKIGDEVHINNRAFLAFNYYYRHHISDDSLYDFLRVDGQPIFPQHGVPLQSPLMGVPYSGQYEGKLIWVHHTHDASLWPPQGLFYKQAVEQAQGPEKAAEKFRLRWTENAEHAPPRFQPNAPDRSNDTWLIEYHDIIEQSLVDIQDWVERGIAPTGTNFTFEDGKVSLPTDATERGGIQPVVAVTANGAVKAEVKAGQPVEFKVTSEVPPGAGTIIGLQWDFEGQGTWPLKPEMTGKESRLEASTTHVYDKPGVYFATALVTAHRDGEVGAAHRLINNLASARVVVS